MNLFLSKRAVRVCVPSFTGRLPLWIVSILCVLSAPLAAHAQAKIEWSQPAAITYGTPLSSTQLNAVAVAGPAFDVDLSSVYNVTGIVSPGTSIPSNGGYDGEGDSFDSTQLNGPITWNDLTYTLGPANGPDVVTGTTSGPTVIPVSAPGAYSYISFLGSVVDNGNTAQTFTINFTSGPSATYSLNMSDWAHPSAYADETDLVCDASRVGTLSDFPACVYGYTIQLSQQDAARTITSITIPSRHVVIFAIKLTAAQLTGSIAYSPAPGKILPVGTNNNITATYTGPDGSPAPVSQQISVVAANPEVSWATPASITNTTPLSATRLDATATIASGVTPVPLSDANVNAIFTDLTPYTEDGFDGAKSGGYHSYSANLLGGASPSVQWNGITFSLGTAGAPDAVSATQGGTITAPTYAQTTVPLPSIPAGASAFNTLFLIGAAANTADQLGQVFTINYADKTTSSATLNMSSWVKANPTPYAGESIVSSMTYYNRQDGTSVQAPAYIYGYSIPVDPTRTPVSVTLPDNRSVVILGMALSQSATPTTTLGSGDGTLAYAYNPTGGASDPITIGSLLPTGTDTLTATFTPVSGSTNNPANASVQIVVTPSTTGNPTLKVSANSATRVYGTANPTFTGSVTGATTGDSFTETFATTPTATIGSNAGTYQIVPTAVGTNLANYTVVTDDGTLTITQAPTTVTTSASSSAITQGTSDTLTATVVPVTPLPSGVAGPTGTVQFFSNGTAIGPAEPLGANGVATLTTTSLPVGADPITAVYSGDQNFIAPTGVSLSLGTGTTVVVGPGTAPPPGSGALGFTLTVTSPLVVNGKVGSTETFTLHVTPTGSVYPGPVQFAATSVAGVTNTYTFSPATIAVAAGATDVTLTVATTSYPSQVAAQTWRPGFGGIALGLLLLPVGALGYRRRAGHTLGRILMGAVLWMVSVGMAVSLTGCGGDKFGYNFVEPIVVTATSGSAQQTATVVVDLPQASK